MKILLVNPPRSPHNAILACAPPEARRFIHKKLVGPPLGLLTLGAAAADHDVTLLEMKGEYDLDPAAPPPEEMVTDCLRRVNPDMVGVTFIASELNAGMDIFRVVKNFNPEILTVAGGLHATLCPGHFDREEVDIVCPGQASGTFRALARAVEGKKGLDGVGGILARTGGGLAPTAAAAPDCDPAGEDFIMPDRSLLRRWISTYTVGKGYGPATYLFTSLGCPHRCSFCSIWPLFDGKFMQRRVESVITELKTLDDYPVVRFADANTIISTQWVERLFDRIEEEGINKDYIMDIRFDTAARNPKLIEKLARGGLKVVISGFESFRNEELEQYNKDSQAGLISDAVRIFHDCGIMVRGNYVVPPEYDEDDFKALADYAASHKVTYAGYTILSPMPGTEFYRQVKDRIVEHDLSKYNFFNSVLKTRLPPERFHENVGRLWTIKRGTDVI
ncbi:MAG: radical SAM protein [Pseudomonadota bacterium]